jgi:hypothetical protein
VYSYKADGQLCRFRNSTEGWAVRTALSLLRTVLHCLATASHCLALPCYCSHRLALTVPLALTHSRAHVHELEQHAHKHAYKHGHGQKQRTSTHADAHPTYTVAHIIRLTHTRTCRSTFGIDRKSRAWCLVTPSRHHPQRRQHHLRCPMHASSTLWTWSSHSSCTLAFQRSGTHRRSESFLRCHSVDDMSPLALSLC